MYSNVPYMGTSMNSMPMTYSSSQIPMNQGVYNNGAKFAPNQGNSDRFVAGGFLGPFILGGITGGLLAPAFYPRPCYGPYCGYGPYGPYYR